MKVGKELVLTTEAMEAKAASRMTTMPEFGWLLSGGALSAERRYRFNLLLWFATVGAVVAVVSSTTLSIDDNGLSNDVARLHGESLRDLQRRLRVSRAPLASARPTTVTSRSPTPSQSPTSAPTESPAQAKKSQRWDPVVAATHLGKSTVFNLLQGMVILTTHALN